MKALCLGVLIAMLLVSGCAEATIRKVRNRSDYTKWSDDDQLEVDRLCGIRYYLSRPYVVVHKPFPISSRTYLIDGILSEDGQHVRLVGDLCRLDAKGREAVQHASLGLSSNVISSRTIWKSDADSTARLQAERDLAAARAQARTSSTTSSDADPLPAPGTDAQEPSKPTGTADIRVSTDLEALGRFKLQDYFELVYLPDFEEQYVIDPRANLGDLNMSLTRGPGGELLAMGMQVDNSAITGPIVDAWEKLVQAGVSAAVSAMGMPQGEVVTPPSPARSLLSDTTRTQAQTVVTLRVHVVRMASAGLYPILKASEMVDTRNCIHGIRDCRICGGQTTREVAAKTHVLPVYPYSRIAYQVHDSIIVEHLLSSSGRPTTPTPLRAAGRPGSPSSNLAANMSDERILQWLDDKLRAHGALQCMIIDSIERSPATAALSGIETLVVRVARVDRAGNAMLAPPSPADLANIRSLLLADKVAMPNLTDLKVVAAAAP